MDLHDLAGADGLTPKKVASPSGKYQSTCPGCLAIDTFVISDTHNSYYCSQCKRRGDAIQYMRDFHCLSFKEACRQLGMELNKDPHTMLWWQPPAQGPVAAEIPNEQWQTQAFRFVMDCHHRLMATSGARSLLYDKGFTDGTMQQFYLGWNTALGAEKVPWPPVGLVLPTFDLGFKRLVKIRVQPVNGHGTCVSVSGRIKSPGVYGDAESKLGSKSGGKPVVVLSSELDAMLVQQCAGDICCPVALGGCRWPDEVFDQVLRQAPLVLFAVGDKTAFTWWRGRYPRMLEWTMPCGKGADEAFRVGVMLRKWVLDGIHFKR